jgi:hypothetical protein
MRLKFLLSILVFCSFLNLRAQVYKAGIVYSNYYDINPDTLISIVHCSSPTCVTNETAAINMFGDYQVDFEIISYFTESFSFARECIFILSKDSNAYVASDRIDSVYMYTPPSSYSWGWKTYVTKPFLLNDTINKPGFTWNKISTWNDKNTYIINKNRDLSNAKHVTDWVGSMDKFIGVKYQTSTDTSYGWIRIHCPDSLNCYVKDFSSTDQFAGIRENSKTGLKIYPNPFNDEIYFENLAYDKIQLFDCLSREVKFTPETSGNKTKLNVDPELPKGIYYLKVSGKNGTFSKKLIKA